MCNSVIPLLNIVKQLFQDGSPKDSFERGMAFKAKCTIFSEGCRGHLGKGLMKHFKLNAGKLAERI
jgi:electron-transferring-flavoprotein dehydrogenase